MAKILANGTFYITKDNKIRRGEMNYVEVDDKVLVEHLVKLGARAALGLEAIKAATK